MGTMICTRCYLDTGVSPEFGPMPVEALIALARNWLCDECLDDVEREALERSPSNTSDR